jgi:ParB/RepB/Spo0J family partition protein
MSTATKRPVQGTPVTARIDQIQIPPDKTDRGAIDPAAIAELAASIAAVGLLQPVLVTIPAKPMGLQYALVAGERRLQAAKSLGWNEIPAILVPDPDVELMRASENLQRVDLNAVEAAVVIGDMLEDQVERELDAVGFAKGTADIPAPALATARIAAVKVLAARMGKPEQYIRDHAFMAELDSKTRKLLVDGRLPVPHARELAKVLDPDKRYEIALRAAADPRGNRGREYAWPIADLRREVAKVYQSLAMVTWKLDAPFAGKPACSECPENSANKPGLFEIAAPVHGWSAFKEPAAGICLSRACFGAKSAAVTRAAGTMARLTISATKPAKGKTAATVPSEAAARLQRSQIVPAFVQPAKFKTAVAEKVDAAKTARKDGAGKSSIPRVDDAAKAAERKLEQAHQKAESEWRSKCVKIFEAAIEARPWLRPFLEPLSRNADSPKIAKKIPPLLDRVFALQMDPPSPEITLLGECHAFDQFTDIDWWVLATAGFFPAIASGLKLEIPPAPVKPAAATPAKGKGKKK